MKEQESKEAASGERTGDWRPATQTNNRGDNSGPVGSDNTEHIDVGIGTPEVNMVNASDTAYFKTGRPTVIKTSGPNEYNEDLKMLTKGQNGTGSDTAAYLDDASGEHRTDERCTENNSMFEPLKAVQRVSIHEKPLSSMRVVVGTSRPQADEKNTVVVNALGVKTCTRNYIRIAGRSQMQKRSYDQHLKMHQRLSSRHENATVTLASDKDSSSVATKQRNIKQALKTQLFLKNDDERNSLTID